MNKKYFLFPFYIFDDFVLDYDQKEFLDRERFRTMIDFEWLRRAQLVQGSGFLVH
jgi:hypothetical protein